MFAFALTGCSAVITDDAGGTYEIPLDEFEGMAKEYVAAEIKTYIADEIKSGKSLGEILGVDDSYIEDIIREEIKGAIAAELKDNNIIGSEEDISGLIDNAKELGKLGESAGLDLKELEVLGDLSKYDLDELAELADLADELGELFAGTGEEDASVKDKSDKKSEDKADKKAAEEEDEDDKKAPPTKMKRQKARKTKK